jgi:hypothetical protein
MHTFLPTNRREPSGDKSPTHPVGPHSQLLVLERRNIVASKSPTLVGPVVQPGKQTLSAQNGRRPHTAKVVGSNPTRPMPSQPDTIDKGRDFSRNPSGTSCLRDIVLFPDLQLLLYVKSLLGSLGIETLAPRVSSPANTILRDPTTGKTYRTRKDSYQLHLRRKALPKFQKHVGFTISRVLLTLRRMS